MPNPSLWPLCRLFRPADRHCWVMGQTKWGKLCSGSSADVVFALGSVSLPAVCIADWYNSHWEINNKLIKTKKTPTLLPTETKFLANGAMPARGRSRSVSKSSLGFSLKSQIAGAWPVALGSPAMGPRRNFSVPDACQLAVAAAGFRGGSHGLANRCPRWREMHLVLALHRPSEQQGLLAFGVVGVWSLWTIAYQHSDCSLLSDLKPTYFYCEKYGLHSYFKAIGWIIIRIN